MSLILWMEPFPATRERAEGGGDRVEPFGGGIVFAGVAGDLQVGGAFQEENFSGEHSEEAGPGGGGSRRIVESSPGGQAGTDDRRRQKARRNGSGRSSSLATSPTSTSTENEKGTARAHRFRSVPIVAIARNSTIGHAVISAIVLSVEIFHRRSAATAHRKNREDERSRVRVRGSIYF